MNKLKEIYDNRCFWNLEPLNGFTDPCKCDKVFFEFETPINKYRVHLCKDYYINRLKQIFIENKNDYSMYVFSVKHAIPYFIKELVEEYSRNEQLPFYWNGRINHNVKNPLKQEIRFIACTRPVIAGYVMPNDLIEYYLKNRTSKDGWSYKLDVMFSELLNKIYFFLESKSNTASYRRKWLPKFRKFREWWNYTPEERILSINEIYTEIFKELINEKK